MSELKAGKWFMQRNGKIEGPFATGLISRHILLGRLQMDDKVSQDGKEWQLVKDVPSLIPDILDADADDPIQQERLMAARRWADERLARDRRDLDADAQADERREARDRRDLELDDVTEHRNILRGRARKNEVKGIFTAGLFLTAVVILIGWAGYYAYQNQPEEVVIDCQAVPKFAVNWTNCILLNKNLQSANLENALLLNARLASANLQSANLRNANMSYIELRNANLIGADMSMASLKGANLSGADLRGASLVNADLSFANLTGANLRNANLDGAILSKAIWFNGSTCAAGSVGECLR
ncbi:MAG: pentapeptide repeat-containing protein [Sulfuriflexus sp.]|nr:pentapeptide repeat-containing protein [Sulfuriflexus sp.]